MRHHYSISVTILLVCAAMFSCSLAVAQVPVMRWEKTYGGSEYDNAKSMCATADGGYVIAGFTSSTDGDVTGLHGTVQDYWLVKTTNTGTIQWQKTLGGSNSELLNCVAQTYDNGYIATGYSFSDDGDVSGHHDNADYWVVKTNDTGGIEWQRSLGGTKNDIAISVVQTLDSGYAVVGNSSSIDGDITSPHDSADCWVVRLSAIGSVLWQKSLGGSRGDGGVAIQQTPDTGFILACSSHSSDGDVAVNHGEYDVWLVKLSRTGDIQWQKSLGGSANDFADGIKLTTDGGYIAICSSNSTDGDVTGNNGGYDYWIVKLSVTGVIEWQKSVGGSSDDFAYSIVQTFDQSYIASGVSFSGDMDVTGNHGSSDMWVTKLSTTGGLVWQKSLGGSSYDGAALILQAADSCYIVAGYSLSSDFMISSSHGNGDYWVVKLCDSLPADPLSITTEDKRSKEVVTITPNPASREITIASTAVIGQLTISNLLGQVVYSRSGDKQTMEIDITSLPSGTYLARLNNREMRRFVKQ